MTRFWVLLVGCLLIAGCEREDAVRGNELAASPDAAASPGKKDESAPNMSVPTSIMRPSVIEEVKASPEPEEPTLPPVTTLVFASGTSGLDEAQRSLLDNLVGLQGVKDGGRVIVRGHSDTRGSDEQNRVASRKRAEAVRDYLVEQGIDVDRVQIIAFGETWPVTPNAKPDGSDSPEGRAKNRRVEIEFLATAEPANPAAVD